MRSQKLLCGFPKRSEKTPEWHIGVSINILFTSHPRGLVAGKGNNPRFREGCSKAISFTVLQSNGFQVSLPHVKSVIFHCLSEFKFSFFFLQSILRPYKFCSGRCQRFICFQEQISCWTSSSSAVQRKVQKSGLRGDGFAQISGGIAVPVPGSTGISVCTQDRSTGSSWGRWSAPTISVQLPKLKQEHLSEFLKDIWHF